MGFSELMYIKHLQPGDGPGSFYSPTAGNHGSTQTDHQDKGRATFLRTPSRLERAAPLA